jgi:shikimate kinase
VAAVVVLAGFMGSGKTSVGRQAAWLLGWDFVDLDVEVAVAAGKTIPEVFATEGEAVFRRLEREALAAALERAVDCKGIVLALGGGTLGSPEAVEMLRGNGPLIYLEVSAEEAWRRVACSDRPLARDRRSFDELLENRRALYEAAADHVIAADDQPVASIARRVADIAREHTKDLG